MGCDGAPELLQEELVFDWAEAGLEMGNPATLLVVQMRKNRWVCLGGYKQHMEPKVGVVGAADGLGFGSRFLLFHWHSSELLQLVCLVPQIFER
mmetsp:Transcript_8664/g.24666  ORF Transcript_8664/g.24666 Transcript_8664/m.24666 type:complete len:94 (+) Transcript_8664:1430-1711(+)